MRNGVPYLVFASGSYLSTAQLSAMHRNLGHPSLEKQMKVIEAAEIDDLPPKTRKKLAKLIKFCKPCQLMQGRPRRFLFSIKDPVIGAFNHKRSHAILRSIYMKLRLDIPKLTRSRNSPNTAALDKIRRLPPGKEVLVFREPGGWIPYPLVRVVRNSVDVILPSGKISSFPINVHSINAPLKMPLPSL